MDPAGQADPADVAGPVDLGPAAAGRWVTDLVHQWRQFPSVDPELPDHLLPARWPGRAAKGLFDRCHRAWLPPALAWVDDLEAASGSAAR
jgi:phenylacetic acid degradation operon negative regulatory protein